MSDSVVVIPCYNEELRLRREGFTELLGSSRIRLLFVDDGSSDRTFAMLRGLCGELRSASVLRLERNQGKAEAVRRGLLSALESGAAFVGYLDADLATPPEEMLRVVGALHQSEAAVALACRLQLPGANIQRNARRRFLGRIFSLAASLVLRARFRDTQCGAKAFRATPALHAALRDPFHARWAFDVELMGRLLTGSPDAERVKREDFVEVPLRAWREVSGSKLRAADVPLLGVELVRIAWELMRLRASLSRTPPEVLPALPEESAPPRVAGAG
jgi:glycosyltransferase involved in cell wall biosynthesis